MRYFELLNEMIVRYGKPAHGETVVAFQGNIWIFNAHQQPKDAKKIIKDINKLTGLKLTSMDDIENEIRDNRPDILCGYITKNHLFVDSNNLKHFVSSPLTKKVVAQLGLSGVTYGAYDFQGDDYVVDYDKTKIVGDIPEIVYHGTCTKYILGILKTGIMPTANKNWDKLKFPGKIFLTADPDYAKFHANKQADQFNCAPVVIATKLPDRTKITLDYDVAHTFHGDDKKIAATGYLPAIKKNPVADYDKPKQKAIRKASPKTDFSKATGIFAYTGRIAPIFFQELFSTLNDEEYLGEDPPFTFRSKAEFLQAFEMYEHYGHYDPDYVPEDDEDDEYRDAENEE